MGNNGVTSRVEKHWASIPDTRAHSDEIHKGRLQHQTICNGSILKPLLHARKSVGLILATAVAKLQTHGIHGEMCSGRSRVLLVSEIFLEASKILRQR